MATKNLCISCGRTFPSLQKLADHEPYHRSMIASKGKLYDKLQIQRQEEARERADQKKSKKKHRKTRKLDSNDEDVDILDLIDVVHSTTKILVDIINSQDSEVGDGIPIVVLLCRELLTAAKGFIQKGVKPDSIIRSFRTAANWATERISDLAMSSKGQTTKVVAGGGAIDMEISRYLIHQARTITGKSEQFIISYAKALEAIPRQLFDDSGLDADAVLNKLRQKYVTSSDECSSYGVDINTGDIVNSHANSLWELAIVKINAINAATGAACLVLSADDIVLKLMSDSAPGDDAGSAMG